MKKKLWIFSILTVLALVVISFTTVVSSNTTTIAKKETPIFKIRTKLAIGEKLQNIKTEFIGNRVFFLPLQFLGDKDDLSPQILLEHKCMITWYTTPTACWSPSK
jgi:hypothetical protein